MKKRALLPLLMALIVSLSLISCNSTAGNDSSYAENNKSNVEMGGNASTDDKTELPSTDTYNRKIIRTATMDCETKDFDGATSFLMATLAEYDGYTESSKVSGTGYREGTNDGSARYATYVCRVPSEKLDAFLSALSERDGIRVVSQGTNTEEVTGTYYDLTTRIATLKTERDSLSQMLAGFTDYNDMNAMLQVQERLYDVIEEIESLQTQLNLYDDKVAMSTVNLSLREVVTYTEAAAPSFGERMGDAFSESWSNFADGCLDFAVWFVGAFPSLLVLGVIVVVVVIVIKRSQAKRQQKKQSSPSNDEDK